MPVKHPYYKYDKIHSYNAMWMFLVGARGLGKTYGAEVKAVRDYIRKGEQFIYLRRYKEELKAARATFFDAFAHEFPEWDFRAKGPEAQIAPADTRDDKKREWFTIGFFVALSTAQNQKSVSFPRVTKIIFDEFIIEKGMIHYLPDEAFVFQNFYNTVDRGQDRTKVYFLANSVSIMNPYFLEYNIVPDEGTEFIVRGDGFLVAHFPDSKEYAKSIYTTKFGKFIQGTDYADFAVGNSFSDNHEQLLNKKDPRARYQFTLETSKGLFSVWHVPFDNEYFVEAKRPKTEKVLTLVAENMSETKTYVKVGDRAIGYLRTAFSHGKLTFDHPTTRNTFTEIFKR